MSYKLNYNLYEVCSLSLDPRSVVILSYLHFNFNKKICTHVNYFKDRLHMKNLPELDFSKLLFKRGKNYISVYQIKNPMVKLSYKKILTLPISTNIKMLYLYYVALIPPYNREKFIPKEVIINSVTDLLDYELATEVKGGIILEKERE